MYIMQLTALHYLKDDQPKSATSITSIERPKTTVLYCTLLCTVYCILYTIVYYIP